MNPTHDSMKFSLKVFTVCAFVAGIVLAAWPAAVRSATSTRIRFGVDMTSTDLARKMGLDLSLGGRMPELKAAGVRGIRYRSIADNPQFDTSNYHGIAARHCGLLRADGSRKPAFAALLRLSAPRRTGSRSLDVIRRAACNVDARTPHPQGTELSYLDCATVFQIWGSY